MRQRTIEQLNNIVETMQALVTERDILADRSKKARIDGKSAKREVADERIRVIDRKLGWYRGRVPADMIPAEVNAIFEAREAESAAAEVMTFTITKSGVRLSDDFRDNLIIDRYDPVFATMSDRKLQQLRSENSEDVVTWNVFRSLRQIDPGVWLPALAQRGLQGAEPLPADGAVVSLWPSIEPPPALVADGRAEGDSEIDIAIESSTWVWFIEAKRRSDICPRTKTRQKRDQVLRNIDVGSYYADQRDFLFSLLVASPEASPRGAEAVARYSDLARTRALLRDHRPDGLANLRAVTLLTWSDLAVVLSVARDSVARIDEQRYADRALEWMQQAKGLGLP